MPFDPSLAMQVDPGKADSPAALSVKLHVPQNEAPEGLATAPLKKAVLTLPQGLSVNTSAASGLEGCSEAQFGLHANEPAHCPDASKVGTAKITTPLLEEPLKGRSTSPSRTPTRSARCSPPTWSQKAAG